MAHPMGDARKTTLRVDFDRRVKLEFHGATSHPKVVFFATASSITRLVGPLGTVFHQEISPMKGQIVIHRTSLGSRSPGVASCATVAGNRESHLGNLGR